MFLKYLFYFFTLFFSATTFSQTEKTSDLAPSAIITSGGVSKGAYQAGFLYYINTHYKLNSNERHRPHIFTGTSAGGINSFISALDYCSDKSDPVRDSAYFQFWQKGGLETIFNPDHVTHNRIFYISPQSDSMQLLRKKWFSGLKLNCKAYLGLTLTHLNSKEYRLSDELVTSQMKETIVLEIIGRGTKKAPSVSVKKIDRLQNFVIDFNGTDEFKYSQIVKLLYATSAFPVAFEPVHFKYCYQNLNEKSCSLYSEDFFVDGGVFNNTPIRLAHKIRKSLGHVSSNFVVVDSDQHIYHASAQEKTKNIDEVKLQDLTSGLFFNFLDASLKNDVADFAREQADNQIKIYSAVTNLPTASEPLAHFWGLFDKDFRSFDFILGMNDARYFLEKKFNFSQKVLFDDETNQKLLCLKNFEECKKITDKNFLILLQTSIYKIYDMCSENKNTELVIMSPHCKSARSENNIPLVNQTKLLDWKIANNESELEYTIRLLHAQNYNFTYLKNSNSVTTLNSEVRAKLRDMLSLLIEKQQGEQLSSFRLIRKNLFDYVLFYEPMNNFWYINVGKFIEVGYRTHPEFATLLTNRFTFSFSALLQSTHVHLDNTDVDTSITPLVGGYYQLPFFENRIHQLSVFGKYGYQISTLDEGNTSNCSRTSSIVACSTQTFQLGAGITFYDHFGVNFSHINYRNKFENTWIQDPSILFNFNIKLD